MKLAKLLSAAAVAGTLAGTSGGAGAVEKLSLVHPFPGFLIYTKSCKQMVERINTAGAGVVQITVRGGPEAIKTFQQAPAVRDGVVDMTCVPAAFYAAAIPENEAVATSNASPEHVRANGGMAILDELHRKHYKTRYLGWIDSGPSFHIYMANPPRFKSGGLPNFDGVKMRDNPIYGAFFRALGATTHNMGVGAVFSALEKGTVNASAWTSIGLMQLKWDKFLRHRIDPKFYQTDIGIIANAGAWGKLSSKARGIVTTAIKIYEGESRAARLHEVAVEKAQLAKGGMKFWPVKGGSAAKYIKTAIDSAYARVEGRLKKRGRSVEFARQLRNLYQK